MLCRIWPLFTVTILMPICAEVTTADETNDLAARITQLENEVEKLKKQVGSLLSSANANTQEAWVEKLVGLRDHMHTAFSVGPELTLLPPDEGLAIVQHAWPRIKVRHVKTGILKAYAFGQALHPKKHPSVLAVLHLGMTDPDPEIQTYAASYLQEYAKEDFDGERDRYAAWYREYGDMSPEEVLRRNTARVPDSLKRQLTELADAFRAGEMRTVQSLAAKIGETEHPYAIPTLIGVIDADNSYDTVYGVGYFGLRHPTGVSYSPYHDGAWWRRWWEANKQRFPDEVATLTIPQLPKTQHGKQHEPFPEDMDTLEGKLRFLHRVLAGDTRAELSDLASAIAEHKDPTAIPTLIGIIEADNTYDTIYGVGHFGLGELTGVAYEKTHDGKWWRRWWDANKHKFAKEVQSIAIPDFRAEVSQWKAARSQQREQDALADVADIPAERLLVDSNEKMGYFLIGPRKNAAPPKDGYKLLVVLPGGDGGEDFHPFVRRLFKHSLRDDFLVAQPIAFKWRPQQQIVWPTRTNQVEGQEFSTEEFVEAVISDVSQKFPMDSNFVFTLSWSSSGPAAYAISLSDDSPVKGSYIAMSVFKPDTLPPLSNAAGHAYFIDHSPDDRVCPFSMAKAAQLALNENGASVVLNNYDGGHGWHGDIYRRVGNGITWLVSQRGKRD
jgi:predicted esterase